MLRLPVIMLAGCVAVAAFLPSCGPVAPAGEVNFEGRNISEVKVIYQKAKTVDEERLRNMIGTRKNTRYAAAKLDDDIKTLYSSGLVDDIRFVPEQDGEEVKVIMEVSTRPAMGPGFGIIGNTVFKDETLAKRSGLKGSGSVSAEALGEACGRLERFYRRQGYANAKVTHRIVPVHGTSMEDILLIIDEGPKVERSWLQRLGFAGKAPGQ